MNRLRWEQVRDNAIVFSMEHVRLIITAECVILPRDGFENKRENVAFLERLEETIHEGAQAPAPWKSSAGWRSVA